MSQWWSWLLVANGTVGIALAGRGRALGWAMLIGNEILWTAYAVQSRQWGFLAGAILYVAAYVANIERARRTTGNWPTSGVRP